MVIVVVTGTGAFVLDVELRLEPTAEVEAELPGAHEFQELDCCAPARLVRDTTIVASVRRRILTICSRFVCAP